MKTIAELIQAVRHLTLRVDDSTEQPIQEGAVACRLRCLGSVPEPHCLFALLLFDKDGIGGAAAVHFATVSFGLGMTNADFLVI